MDKNKNRENDIEIITELNESNDSNKIEDTIQDMLNKVMEEKEPLNNSFNFYDDEDDSFKISRHSTRHQTTVKSIGNNSKNPNVMAQFFIPDFNRGNKRNLTQASTPSFRNYYNSNFPFMTNNPFFYSNNGNNFIPNYYNNNLAFNNNNLNQSFQSYHSFNPQYSNNYQNNFIRNTMPYSKTVSYHNQGNILNLGNNNFQPNFFNYGNNNNKNNKQLIFNRNNKSGFFPMNSDMEFKRGENRKKTYDTQNNLISNCLNNNNINNNLCFNKQFEDQLFNNSFINNNNNIYINNTNDNNNIKNNNDSINNIKNEISNNISNNSNNNININDNLIYELKHLLERTGKIDYYIYNFVKGNFLSIIKNHKGSKIFQKYLKSTHSDEILHLIFIELSPNLEELIIDPYANYFCKKFFSYLNPMDRIEFLKCIQKSLIKLSSDSIGTYPIQTIIEHLNTKNEKMIIISAISEHFQELIYDPYGCHVLEKLLICFEDEYIGFIYSYIFENFLYLSNNNNGICIIKKILTFTNKKGLHDKLKNIVKENALYLIQQSYGNFVIQVIIEYWTDYKDIITLFKGNFFKLSLEKYASNVIERCLEKDEEILNEYIDEIIENNCIHDVMKSNYGNYVIQKAIKLSKGEHKNKFVFSAAKEINKLNDNKLIQKWKSILLPHIKELTPEQIQELKSQNYFCIKK
jgi:hypothetical protein